MARPRTQSCQWSDGLVQHRRQHLGDVADEGLVGTEEEVQRLLEPEAAALEQVDTGASVVSRTAAA